MTIYVIYHANCNDGFCAAWIASDHLSSEGTPHEVIPAKYGDLPPAISAGDRVFILDFSYPRQVLLDMARIADVTVLDHHKTAQADLQDLSFAMFDMDRSGAMMAWEYFIPARYRAPQLVEYIQDRDLWRGELPDTDAVIAWLRSWPQDFVTWSRLAAKLERHMAKVIAEGEAILRFIDRQVSIATGADRIRMLDVGGYTVPVVNETHHFGEVAGELAERKDQPFGAVYFDRGDGKRQWSLRSVGDFDVSQVARTQGGGGHKNAAGFTEAL